jgi:hypothetical protein
MPGRRGARWSWTSEAAFRRRAIPQIPRDRPRRRSKLCREHGRRASACAASRSASTRRCGSADRAGPKSIGRHGNSFEPSLPCEATGFRPVPVRGSSSIPPRCFWRICYMEHAYFRPLFASRPTRLWRRSSSSVSRAISISSPGMSTRPARERRCDCVPRHRRVPRRCGVQLQRPDTPRDGAGHREPVHAHQAARNARGNFCARPTPFAEFPMSSLDHAWIDGAGLGPLHSVLLHGARVASSQERAVISGAEVETLTGFPAR